MTVAGISTAVSTLKAAAAAPEPAARAATPGSERLSALEAAHRFEQAVEASPTAPSGGEPRVMDGVSSASAGDISPADLYRAQFVVGMFKTEGVTGAKSTQQLTQDMETLMKQQG